jgi:hypothetical protein
MTAIRLSPRRTLQRGPRQLLLREPWKCEAGKIVQAKEDYFIVISCEDGTPQFWLRSFAEAYLQLTGEVWHAEPEEGGIASKQSH